MLPSLSLRISYRTGQDNLVRDFFVPCLEESVLYRRATGYFTSAGLAMAARGVARLALRENGRMRLVASPCLEEEDVAALEDAGANPEEVLRRVVLRSMDDAVDFVAEQRLNALAWLAASGKLEIKLAIRLTTSGRPARGIYHEKVGIFSDDRGNNVTFAGSSNETQGGLVENFESIKVFWSWDDPQNRVQDEIEHFERLWNGDLPALRVFEFSAVSHELLERYRKAAPPDAAVEDEAEPASDYKAQPRHSLRPYQREALEAWKQADGKGILAMATGTGKTKTALHLAARLGEKMSPFMTIIVCPYINLVLQWQREIEQGGARCIACYGARSRWEEPLRNQYQRLQAGLDKCAYIVVTNATFCSREFQQTIRRPGVNQLLVADEAHNLGADKALDALPDHISLRLGLSATPKRHMDDEGTNALLAYFGGIVYEFGLKEAIQAGYLCPYRYYPVLVDLDPDEAEIYAEISEELKRNYREDEHGRPSEYCQKLLIKRARVLASARDKIRKLEALVAGMGNLSRALIYCGDGSVAEKPGEEENRQIHAVAEVLGARLGYRLRQFTYREKLAEREEILDQLRDEFLDGIIAIRCLDEGIDLPEVRTGFLLASTTNPRQAVQRRGRLLRKAPGKTHAEIYDFIVVPPDLGGRLSDDAFNLERKLFRRELLRVVEFCETADNGPTALASLLELRKEYNLLAI